MGLSNCPIWKRSIFIHLSVVSSGVRSIKKHSGMLADDFMCALSFLSYMPEIGRLVPAWTDNS